MSAREAGRGLTAEAFGPCSRGSVPTPSAPGAAYEALRHALISFFTWRGAFTPEECADETLDRLASRLSDGEPVEDVPRFTRGIARLILLEHWRRPDFRRAPLDEVRPEREQGATAPGDDALQDCLNQCLGELPPDGRELILEYYVTEDRSRIEERKRVAEALGVSESALRNRAQRLRNRIERCITRCLGGSAGVRPRAASNDTKQ